MVKWFCVVTRLSLVSPAGCACRWLSAARSPRVRRQREGLAARPRSAGRAEERRRVGAAPPRMRRTLPGGAATRSRAATERRWYAPDPASDRRGSARCTTRLGCAESILSPRDPRARPGRGAPGRREQGLARPPAQGPHRAKTAAGSRARMQQSCIRGGIARLDASANAASLYESPVHSTSLSASDPGSRYMWRCTLSRKNVQSWSESVELDSICRYGSLENTVGGGLYALIKSGHAPEPRSRRFEPGSVQGGPILGRNVDGRACGGGGASAGTECRGDGPVT